uniref:SHSP domain-containing protein n=1 Tax=Mola mola TaxID=94237 RepID=A0A3Q3W9P8_MOLML
MSQHSTLTSLFGDDPFFSQGKLLWPLRCEAVASMQQDFFSQRAKLVDSLLKDFHDRPNLLKLPLMSSTLTREAQQTLEHNGDLLVTLDARGYAPSDITVKLEGRSLAVVAMKQAGAEETQSSSSQMSFARTIDLPDHLDLSGLSCFLMDDGQLRIHAPVAKQSISEERQVPIRFRTSLEFPISKDEGSKDYKANSIYF